MAPPLQVKKTVTVLTNFVGKCAGKLCTCMLTLPIRCVEWHGLQSSEPTPLGAWPLLRCLCSLCWGMLVLSAHIQMALQFEHRFDHRLSSPPRLIRSAGHRVCLTSVRNLFSVAAWVLTYPQRQRHDPVLSSLERERLRVTYVIQFPEK